MILELEGKLQYLKLLQRYIVALLLGGTLFLILSRIISYKQ
jgi:hypothetical protein